MVMENKEAARSFRNCRTALSRTGLDGYARALNPYLGCEFGCIYCYATYMARYRSGNEQWGRFIEAKRNIVEVLEGELSSQEINGKILLSSVCDPYQNWERELELTRSCLKQLLAAGSSVSILTKSDLVTRDIELLASIPQVEVGFSITTMDSDIAGQFEPGAPSPNRRLAAATRLIEAGIPVWFFVAPVLPPGGAGGVLDVIDAAGSIGVERVLIDSMNRKRYIADRMKGHLKHDQYENVMDYNFGKLKRELKIRLRKPLVEVEFIF